MELNSFTRGYDPCLCHSFEFRYGKSLPSFHFLSSSKEVVTNVEFRERFTNIRMYRTYSNVVVAIFKKTTVICWALILNPQKKFHGIFLYCSNIATSTFGYVLNMRTFVNILRKSAQIRGVFSFYSSYYQALVYNCSVLRAMCNIQHFKATGNVYV